MALQYVYIYDDAMAWKRFLTSLVQCMGINRSPMVSTHKNPMML